jgi:hypothetical protein
LKKTKTAVIILISLTIALIAILETTSISSAQPPTNISLSDSLLTNDTIPFKITNVHTIWRIEHPEQIQFNFSVAEKPLLITYNLDNQAKKVVSGNFTLTNLTNGRHNVTLYVTDKSGNTVYNTYTAKLPEQRILPDLGSNSILIAILAILSIIIAMSILLFRTHRKPISQNKPNV